MTNLEKVKQLLQSIELDDTIKKKIKATFEDFELEYEELKFLSEKYQRDQEVNESFLKKTVNLLEASNEHLQISNEELLHINNKLSKSNEELERFAFIASHDLKTPIQNINNFSQLLKTKLQHNSKEINEYLFFIINEGQRAMNLIEGLLEYSSQSKESNDIVTEISLKDVIKDVVNALSEFLDSKNAKIEISHSLPTIRWRYSKIYILFKHLIENGVTYNESSSPIVKIYCTKSDNKYSLSCEDNGIGIKDSYHDKIFKMFTRLHNHIEYEGTGLGLASCKEIVTEFGGTISVESQPNIKTIFTIDFPTTLVIEKRANSFVK